MQTYFEKDHTAIYHKFEEGVLIVEFKLPPTSEEFRESMEEVIEAIQYFKTGKVIFDTRRFGILLDQDQQWTAGMWYPRAVKAGYCKVAFVNPPDVFTQISVEETTGRVYNRIPTRSFENVSDALVWIVSGIAQGTATFS